MPWRLRAAVAGALMACLPLVATACGAARPMPGPSTVDPGHPALRVLAFYDDRAEKPSGTVLPLIAANRSAIWQLAPLWYKVMPDGSVQDTSESDVKAFARKNHIVLMPLVVNANGTSNFLLNAGTCSSGPCAKAVSQLAAILQRENYDGLNIDFELLKNQARSGLTAFMTRLHERTMAMHKVLTVDVIPAGNRRQAARAYDFPALAKNSDDLVLMTYDAHDDSSKAGPIAPLKWVKQRVQLALSLGVPRNKLILGLADYGYDWTAPGHATTLGLKDVDKLIAQKGISIRRSADGSPHFTYTVGGTTHTVWYEDGRSILPKIQYARAMHLKGLALWMAGYETAHYWHSLRAAAGTLTTTGAFSGATSATTSTSTACSSATGGSSTSTGGSRASSSAASSSGAAGSSSTSASTSTPSSSVSSGTGGSSSTSGSGSASSSS